MLIQGPDHCSLLHYAAKTGNGEIVKYILDHGESGTYQGSLSHGVLDIIVSVDTQPGDLHSGIFTRCFSDTH